MHEPESTDRREQVFTILLGILQQTWRVEVSRLSQHLRGRSQSRAILRVIKEAVGVPIPVRRHAGGKQAVLGHGPSTTVNALGLRSLRHDPLADARHFWGDRFQPRFIPRALIVLGQSPQVLSCPDHGVAGRQVTGGIVAGDEIVEAALREFIVAQHAHAADDRVGFALERSVAIGADPRRDASTAVFVPGSQQAMYLRRADYACQQGVGQRDRRRSFQYVCPVLRNLGMQVQRLRQP